jgi:tetratricopeptide (TPR) repeat protein
MQPNNEMIEMNIAEFHLLIGNVKEARRGYQSVIKKNPRNALAYFGLGNTWKEENLEESIKYYR